MTHLLAKTVRYIFKTHNFIILKSVMYAFFTLISFVILWLVFYFEKKLSLLWLEIMLGIFIWFAVFFFFKKFIFTKIKAGHIALLTQLIEGTQVPAQAQVSYGLSFFNETFHDRKDYIYFTKTITKSKKIKVLSLFFPVVSMITSYIFLKGNSWETTKTALTVYSNHEIMEKNIMLFCINSIFSILLFFIFFFLVDIFSLSSFLGPFEKISWFVVLIFTLFIKIAFFNQATMVASIIHFHDIATKPVVQSNPAFKQLLPYITQYRAQGWSNNQIKNAFVNRGWDEKTIMQALKNS